MLERENEWPIGDDGLPTREAARIILISPRRRVLLIQGHDFTKPEAKWWFTVGGGREPDEDARTAAVRECFEETGYTVAEEALIGPVIYRDSRFYFADRTRRQREHFFIAHVPEFPISRQNWTRDERDVLDCMRWFSMEELMELATAYRIYPRALPQLLPQWVTKGWDGTCVKIIEE
ncbi:MAG: NUDIX domain-containing protein [Actinomycetaceae bacterium]|nr:NUDIX domain-containing protein [Actinomycetaceae bacterium]